MTGSRGSWALDPLSAPQVMDKADPAFMMNAPVRVMLVAALVAMAAAPVASAHQPVTVPGDAMLAIDDVVTSWSIDGTLASPEDVAWLRLTVREGEELTVEPAIPDGLEAGVRTLGSALVATGLPAPPPGSLPSGVVLAEGEGAIVHPAGESGAERSHLGFTWWFFEGYERDDMTGDVHLAIWSPDAPTAFTVAIGRLESPPATAPVYLREPAPGEPASAVPASDTLGDAATPNAVQFLYREMFAPHASPWLPVVLIGVPLGIAVMLGWGLRAAVRRHRRRRRAA